MADSLQVLTAPYHVVTIGGQVFERCVIGLHIASSRVTPADRAEIELNNVNGQFSGLIQHGDVVRVDWGYRDVTQWPVFIGYVRRVIEGRVLQVVAVDSMAALFDTRLTISFIDETPKAIIRWALIQIGIADMAIHEEPVSFPRCNIFDRTVNQIIEMVNTTLITAFGIDEAHDYRWFFDLDGKFHYGPYREEQCGRNPQGAIPVLAYQDNLIELQPAATAGGLSYLQTVAIPYLRHSMQIKVLEPVFGQIDGRYRVERVEYKQTGKRMRCDVWFNTAE